MSAGPPEYVITGFRDSELNGEIPPDRSRRVDAGQIRTVNLIFVSGAVDPEAVRAPIYFMTDDDVSRGSTQTNLFTGKPYDAVGTPSRVESVIATLPTGPDGAAELWKLNHYYERLDEWAAEHGVPAAASPAAEPFWELHNMTTDPEERSNAANERSDALADMRELLDVERDAKRLVPALRNAAVGA